MKRRHLLVGGLLLGSKGRWELISDNEGNEEAVQCRLLNMELGLIVCCLVWYRTKKNHESFESLAVEFNSFPLFTFLIAALLLNYTATIKFESQRVIRSMFPMPIVTSYMFLFILLVFSFEPQQFSLWTQKLLSYQPFPFLMFNNVVSFSFNYLLDTGQGTLSV